MTKILMLRNIFHDVLRATFLMKSLLFWNLSVGPDASYFGTWMSKESCRFIVLSCIFFSQSLAIAQAEKTRQKI